MLSNKQDNRTASYLITNKINSKNSNNIINAQRAQSIRRTGMFPKTSCLVPVLGLLLGSSGVGLAHAQDANSQNSSPSNTTRQNTKVKKDKATKPRKPVNQGRIQIR